MTIYNVTQLLRLVSGETPCRLTSDCSAWPGYICHNNRCICDPDLSGLFSPCAPVNGNKCRSDIDCNLVDLNLVCARADKTCKCRRGFVWDLVSRRCYKLDDDYGPNKIGTVSDLIGTLIFILGVGAMMYLLIKLFCNCKLWRRNNSAPRADIPRSEGDPQCIPMNSAPGTWVASYRVIGSLDHSPSSQFAGRNNPSIPPYLLFPGAAPPPYEEALKHKVILSSYPSQAPVSPLSLQQAQNDMSIESNIASDDLQTPDRPNSVLSEDGVLEQRGGASSS